MDTGKAALGGLDGNLAAALGYPIGIIALLSFFMEKENKFVKFHAAQSLLFGIGGYAVVFVLWIVIAILGTALSQVSSILGTLVFVVGMLVWLLILVIFAGLLFAAYKAYSGEMFKLPVVGNIAEGLANK